MGRRNKRGRKSLDGSTTKRRRGSMQDVESLELEIKDNMSKNVERPSLSIHYNIPSP